MASANGTARWHPPAGTTALIEPTHPEPGCESITAVVLDADGLLVDLGASPRPRSASFDATASFFTPDALFHARCLVVAHHAESDLYEIVLEQLDRVERRADPRIDVDLRCSVAAVDETGAVRSVTGRARNVSRGGCRIVLDRQCPRGEAPLVSLELADGNLVAEAFVIAAAHDEDAGPGGWDYRMAFTTIDPADRDRLAALA